MQPRTKRQKEVLEFVTQYIEKHGYEPSYQQIAQQRSTIIQTSPVHTDLH